MLLLIMCVLIYCLLNVNCTYYALNMSLISIVFSTPIMQKNSKRIGALAYDSFNSKDAFGNSEMRIW